MTSQELGSTFEITTHDFFLILFDLLQIQVNNNWIQKSGSQCGFDVGFEIATLYEDFFTRGIFVECKNYKSAVLDKGKLHEKLIEFDMSAYKKKSSIFIFLSPKIELKKTRQDSNPKLLEDYFNSSKDFKTIILTPNNRIKDIFSLDKKIFQEVYQNEIHEELDEEKRALIIEYFKKLFYSKGEIPDLTKIVQRKKYLEEASKKTNAFYVERKLRGNKYSSRRDKRLLDLIKENDLVLLLGEPGSGKTTELINASKYFEKNIEKLGITPIFVSLSNITQFETVNDILPKDWQRNRKIVLLLDALDEFQFKKYLAKEVESLYNYPETSFKIIVSCRTYAYNEELTILNPSKFYLDSFNYDQSYEFLKNKYGISASFYTQINISIFKNILEDPFMVDRLGQYFQNENNVPDSPFQLYHKIEQEIKADEIEIYKIFAIVLELSQMTSINKVELKDIFGIKYKRLEKLELIQSSFDNNSFKFIHKNYQEYFAASAISNLDFNEIINFISIEGINKTRPTLFNTITFLVNILSADKHNYLVSWLIKNDPELLIKSDKSRNHKFRNKVFQDYFKDQYIDNTFWITSNRTFSVKEIAEFADSTSNFDYLIKLLEENNFHFRTLISAIELLSHFTIPPKKKEKLKNIFFKILNNQENSEILKSNVLECIAAQKLCVDDTSFLNKIFNLFRIETSKQINRGLLYILEDINEIDNFFWFLKAEFLRDKGIVQRTIPDDVMRGTSWALETFLIRLENAENFVDLAKYYFDEDKYDFSDNIFMDKLINRFIYFNDCESNVLCSLLSHFNDETILNLKEDAFKKLLLKSTEEIQLQAFIYLIEKFNFDSVRYFLATITNEKNIEIVIARMESNSFKSENLEYYRNVIANLGKRQLAEYFTDKVEKAGNTFINPLPSHEEVINLSSKLRNRPQKNFDLLFSRSNLLKAGKAVFDKYGQKIDATLIRKIKMDWHRKNSHSGTMDIIIVLISRYIHQVKPEVKYKDFENLVDNDSFLIQEIRRQIENKNESSNNFQIKDSQIKILYDWCIKNSKNINFNNIIKYIDINHFLGLKDYSTLNTILFFCLKFDFNMTQDFYLNSIEFTSTTRASEDDKFLWLQKKINNDKLFNQRVIFNLRNKKLPFIQLNNHLQYALEQNLTETFDIIKKIFQSSEYNFSIDSKLKKFYTITNDLQLLKDLCNDVQNHKCWSALKILMESKIEMSFCEEKAIEYLSIDIDDEKDFHGSLALGILFELNSVRVLSSLLHFFTIKKMPSLNQSSFVNFNAIQDYKIIDVLYINIYSGEHDHLGRNSLHNFMTVYTGNLSKNKNGFEAVQLKLKELKHKLKQENPEFDQFYINLLIDNSLNSYINSQSKALSFSKALQKVEQIIN